MERYERICVVGQGTYGVVTKSIELATGRVVAIKKIRMGDASEGVSFVALREIKILQEIHQDNVINLIDVFSHGSNIHLVFEFALTDLEVVIQDRSLFFSPADVKSYMLMLLRGVQEIHTHWVLHRDLKPNNLLIGTDGKLKITDFGLARPCGSPNRLFTHQVVTRWYRAPELLFGARTYTTAVDMWAVGCIFAELMLRTAYLPGESDLDQLGKMFAALGTPTEEIWPGVTSLPDYVEYDVTPAPGFSQLFTAASEGALDLLSRLLVYNPLNRISAEDALKHRYFTKEAPSPSAPSQLPLPKAVLDAAAGTSAPPPEKEGEAATKRRRTNPNTVTMKPKKLGF
eukprot:TRINITY_DN2817_c0_g1_i1.p1 TRINITY_DN2817_c0_g1~~TRINITY_DN2817_c0_g1_i1.p1  ORF type:complete len:343 (-),score=59.47 TRINITY_DN2817_c0_g1_i1:137-1165(-)